MSEQDDILRIAQKWSLGSDAGVGAICGAITEFLAVQAARRRSGLTRKQREALEFIQTYISDHGYPPSYEEIRKGLGMSSKSGVSRLVAALTKRGLITMLPGKARTIALA